MLKWYIDFRYLCTMIHHDKVLISDDIRDVYFCCNLKQCKGACCVEGDAGAPLEEEEISFLEDYIDSIKPFMVEKGINEVEVTGVFDYDADGKFVTPLVNGNECSFVYLEEGIARCAIEKAFSAKMIPFPKPLSCHLYPIRVSQVGNQDALNYHKWRICNKALINGMNLKTPLYRFLEEPLIRKYGRTWYNQLLKLLY
jgi:hypothetical protein